MKRKRTEVIYNTIAIVITLLMMFPLYWMITSSFKSIGEIFAVPPTFYPHSLDLKGYLNSMAGGNIPIYHYFLNSVIIASCSMVLTMLLAVPAAYGLARYKNKLVTLMLLLFIITQLLPSPLILTPLFISFSKIHIINTYLAPILADATLTIPFSIIILRTYYLKLPSELEDSARIDGCNRFTSFLYIGLPISYPGVFVSAAIAFMMSWGDLIFAMTLLNKEKLRPISLTLYNSMSDTGTQWNALMACATIIVLPILLMFIFLQRYIVSGLTAGALKE